MFYSQVPAPGFLLYSIGGNWYKECSISFMVGSTVSQEARRLLNDHESLEASTAWSSMEPWDCASHHVWATQSVGIGQAIQGVWTDRVRNEPGKEASCKHWRMYQANATSTCPGLQASWVKVCQSHMASISTSSFIVLRRVDGLKSWYLRSHWLRDMNSWVRIKWCTEEKNRDH